MWSILGSSISQKVIRKVRAREMIRAANLCVSHPYYPCLHLNQSFHGSRWVIGWKFSLWGGGHIYFQTQHERVQSSVLNVINKEARDLLSIFLVTVTALPRTVKRNFTES